MSQAVCEPLIGEETGRCHHLKRARDDVGGAKPCVLVEVDPLLKRVDLHPRTDLVQEHFACLGSRRLAPEEFGREHASTWLADPYQLPCCMRAVDEHSDGLGDHAIEGVVGKVKCENVAMSDGDLSGKSCAPDIGAGTAEHDGRDVYRGHLRTELACDCHRGRTDATAHVQDLLVRPKVSPSE